MTPADGPATTRPAPAPAPTAGRSGQGRHRREGGERTRTELMDVAEALFAEHGVDGVSVRSINAAAGVAAASVHYHFRDKDGLVRAVISRRGAEVVERQAELLTAVEARDRPAATDVVRLLADPFLELLAAEPEGGRRWLAIIANLVATDDARLYQVGFGEGSVQERINACAVRAYPALDRELVLDRWRMASTALLQLIATEAARAGGMTDERAEAIVAFVAHGLDGTCA